MQFRRGNKKRVDYVILRQLVGTNGKNVLKRSQNLKSCLTSKINFQALFIVFTTLIKPKYENYRSQKLHFPQLPMFSHPRNFDLGTKVESPQEIKMKVKTSQNWDQYYLIFHHCQLKLNLKLFYKSFHHCHLKLNL